MKRFLMSVLLLVAILVVTPRVLSLLYGDANDAKARKTELPQVDEEAHANQADTIDNNVQPYFQ